MHLCARSNFAHVAARHRATTHVRMMRSCGPRLRVAIVHKTPAPSAASTSDVPITVARYASQTTTGLHATSARAIDRLRPISWPSRVTTASPRRRVPTPPGTAPTTAHSRSPRSQGRRRSGSMRSVVACCRDLAVGGPTPFPTVRSHARARQTPLSVPPTKRTDAVPPTAMSIAAWRGPLRRGHRPERVVTERRTVPAHDIAFGCISDCRIGEAAAGLGRFLHPLQPSQHSHVLGIHESHERRHCDEGSPSIMRIGAEASSRAVAGPRAKRLALRAARCVARSRCDRRQQSDRSAGVRAFSTRGRRAGRREVEKKKPAIATKP